MSDILPPSPIMTVADFRKVTGKETECFSDKQVAEIIQQLDFMAELFIKRAKAGKEQPPMQQTS